MAEQTRATLKTYFETGDYPTQQNFADLIDSAYNKAEDVIDSLPNQAGASGLFLTSDGTSASWTDIIIPEALPDQAGFVVEDKILTTNSGSASWQGGDFHLNPYDTERGASAVAVYNSWADFDADYGGDGWYIILADELQGGVLTSRRVSDGVSVEVVLNDVRKLPYVAGRNGESRVIVDKNDELQLCFISLPMAQSNCSWQNISDYSFIKRDFKLEIDTSYFTGTTVVILNTTQSSDKGLDIVKYNGVLSMMDSPNSLYMYEIGEACHFQFEAYPWGMVSPYENPYVTIYWKAVGLYAMLFSASSRDGWGNNANANSEGYLQRYTHSEAEYDTHVYNTTTINNYQLSSNITLTSNDVSALPIDNPIVTGTLIASTISADVYQNIPASSVISNAPTGNNSLTDVQTYLDDLYSNKVSLSGTEQLSNKEFRSYSETVYTIPNAVDGGNVTPPLSAGTIQTIAMTASFTLSLPPANAKGAGKGWSLILVLTGTGFLSTITFPGGSWDKWINTNSMPNTTSGKKTVYSIVSDGTTRFCTLVYKET